MTKRLQADLALLMVAIVWGSTFVLTKNALEFLPTFNFLAIRFSLAFLICVLLLFRSLRKLDLKTILYGAWIGTLLFLGYALQTFGLVFTTASKSGFITGFSIVIVPILMAILKKEFPELQSVFGVLLALIGLAFLSLDSAMGLNLGDFLTLLCTFCFALHIIYVGHYTTKVNSINLAVVQIGVVALHSTLFTFIFEDPVIPTHPTAWNALLVTAVLATALAFIVQNIMQQHTTETHTALIYSGEPVFCAITAYFFGGEILTNKAILGCTLILLGMLAAELKLSNFIKKKSPLPPLENVATDQSSQ